MYLRRGLKLLVPAVNDHWTALSYNFSLAIKDWQPVGWSAWCSVASKRHVHGKRLSHQNGTCLWFLGALWAPKLSSHKHQTWKMCFILALTYAKRVSESIGLSFLVQHIWGWKSCTFSCSWLHGLDPEPLGLRVCDSFHRWLHGWW